MMQHAFQAASLGRIVARMMLSRRRTATVAVAVVALCWCGAASAGLADQSALAKRFAPVVRHRHPGEGVRSRRAVSPARRRRPLRRRHGLAARTVEPHRPDLDRADGNSGRERALRIPPRLPGGRTHSRLHVRAMGAHDLRRDEADRLRARRHPGGASGEAGVAVLAVLRLQRLEQLPRRRLGDDPAPLRRVDSRGRPGPASGRGRLQPARGCGAGELG